jgi:hypothetical protein
LPSIFELLVATGDPFPSLRLIRLEGDQVLKRHVALFQTHFSAPCRLVNGLGATETGLTRQYFIDVDQSIQGNAVPIGFATPDRGRRSPPARWARSRSAAATWRGAIGVGPS